MRILLAKPSNEGPALPWNEMTCGPAHTGINHKDPPALSHSKLTEARRTPMSHIDATLARLASLFSKQGNLDYIGDPISIAQHSYQAGIMASKNDSTTIQVAALLHDIGHLLGLEAELPPSMDGCGTLDHEGVAARFLAKLGFPHSVTHLVANHVNAKRYLCAVDPSYRAKLSDASKTTLRRQGGAMSAEEVTAFQQDPLFESMLRMRALDEAAKNPHAPVYEFERDFAALVRSYLKENGTQDAAKGYVVSEEQFRAWRETGTLVIRGLFDGTVVQAETHKVQTAPKGTFLDYFEEIAGSDEPKLCRLENFCKDGWWGQAARGTVSDIVGQIFSNGEGTDDAVLFKDKMNMKPPGGMGFACHQDVTAYKAGDLVDYHISVMVAVDESTPAKGPLEVVGVFPQKEILANTHGAVNKNVEDVLEFRQVLVAPGDIVLFDSYIPHRSGQNVSTEARRAAFLTYNKKSAGDHHAHYYAIKKQEMPKGAMSLNMDFNGKLVPN
ncbi:hypothetical protein BC830DRAFT_1237500 [Chytriomyces sp. MP71]|nr:hypothetical protein BC830DRAFT_1237500 [Chytriomyces sp. MP71]